VRLGGGEGEGIKSGRGGRCLRCPRCQREVVPRVSRYGFLLLGWRGHDRRILEEGGRRHDVRVTLCGPCAQECQEGLDQFLVGAMVMGFGEGVIRCGE
jgi:hypothetical protein